MSYHGEGGSGSILSRVLNVPNTGVMLNGDTLAVTEPVISRLSVDTSDLPTAEATRQFTVLGDIGAKFIIFITKGGTKNYYDFVNHEFSSGHNSANNNLVVSLTNKSYAGTIAFPSGGGEFNISLIALPGTHTRKGNGVIHKKILKQASDITVTLKPFTSNTSNYATFPQEQSTGATAESNNVRFDWNITNASSDGGGFGLIPTGDFKDLNNFANLWFFTTTETVDGAVSLTDDNEGYIVKVDDLTDIGIGSAVTAVSGGSLSGQPVVRSINIATKEIKLSIPQAFADGITLTFRAYGSDAINEAIGVRISTSFDPTNNQLFTSTNVLTKTIRAGSSGTTINLNGTYGAGHNDDLTSIEGVGITTASIVSVSASSSAGSMVVNASQGSLTVGTTVRIYGIVQVFNVIGSIEVIGYPSANKNIYLDIDQFLTPGTQS